MCQRLFPFLVVLVGEDEGEKRDEERNTGGDGRVEKEDERRNVGGDKGWRNRTGGENIEDGRVEEDEKEVYSGRWKSGERRRRDIELGR